MKEIGLKLKAKREENGVTIEEAAEDLKLRPSQIVSVEDGDMSHFKDVFYLKSFIKDYANYLGLNANGLVDDFNEFLFDYTSKIPIDEIEKAKKEKKEQQKEIISPYTRKKKEKIVISSYVIYAFVGVLVLIVSYILIINYNNSKIEKDNITMIGGN